MDLPMSKPIFSVRTITAIVDVLTGGSGDRPGKRYGVYRKGPEIERFFGSCGVKLEISGQSRVPAVKGKVAELNQSGDLHTLAQLIERSLDPEDFRSNATVLQEAVQYLNGALRSDGFELRESDGQYQLESLAPITQA